MKDDPVEQTDGGQRSGDACLPLERRNGLAGRSKVHDRSDDALRADVLHDGQGAADWSGRPAGFRLPRQAEDLFG